VASPCGAPKGEGPRSLRTGGLLSMLRRRWRTERQRPRHFMPTDTKVVRHDTVFSLKAERDTDHSHGLTRANPGLFYAGNDRNARHAGLQEDWRPR
jgi:hypothetical protein